MSKLDYLKLTTFKARSAYLKDLILKISAYLPGYVLRTHGEQIDYSWYDLGKENGQALNFSINRQGRLEIYADCSMENSRGESIYLPNDVERPQITVSLDKDPEKIASDITKRLLPAYDLAWTALQNRVDSSNALVAEHEGVISPIRDSGLFDVRENGHGDGKYSIYAKNDNVRYSSDITVYDHSTTVRVTFNGLTPEQLIKIFNALEE